VKITLMRHGKPEFELSGRVSASELSGIAKSYDMSGIVDSPPKESLNLVGRHNIIVSSDLPRSRQSTASLGVSEVHSADALFRETSIPHFNNGSLKLPMSSWLIILRCMWFCGYAQNGEAFLAAKARAKEAAQFLITLAKEFNSVLLVGHGFINYFIAKELLSENWVGPSRPGKRYWEYGVYSSLP